MKNRCTIDGLSHSHGGYIILGLAYTKESYCKYQPSDSTGKIKLCINCTDAGNLPE